MLVSAPPRLAACRENCAVRPESARGMIADTLSDLLRAVRLRGAVFFYVEGAAPWVAEAPAAQTIIPAILPGVDHMMEFHVAARGGCWAAVVGQPPVRLDEGDVVIFPQGDHHVVSSAPGLRADTVDTGAYFTVRRSQLPLALSASPQGTMTARIDGGGGAETTLVCGF